LVTVAAAIGGLLLLALFIRTFQTQPFVDFDAYYRTISDFRSGGHLYAQALTWRDAGYAVNSPGNDSQNADGLPFVYPPTFALAMAPLTLLPYKVALFGWFIVIVGSIVGTAHLLLRMLLPLERRYHVMLVIAITGAMAFFQPIRGILATGNVDTLILFLLTLSLSDYRSGHKVRAGVWLALAGLIKPTAGFVLLFFLWKRAWRTLVACGVVGGVLLAASALTIGVNQTLDFISVASYWSSPTFAVSPVNQAPYGLLLRLFTVNPYTVPVLVSPLLATVLRVVVVGGVLLVLARVIRPSRNVSPMRLALEYSLVLIGMLMASPLSEDIHFTYLGLPLIVIGCAAFTQWPHRTAQLVAAALLVVFAYLSLPLLGAAKMAFYTFYVEPVSMPRLLLTGVHLYGLVVLAGVALITLRRQTLVDRDAIPHG
jgi:hypothetical protein